MEGVCGAAEAAARPQGPRLPLQLHPVPTPKHSSALFMQMCPTATLPSPAPSPSSLMMDNTHTPTHHCSDAAMLTGLLTIVYPLSCKLKPLCHLNLGQAPQQEHVPCLLMVTCYFYGQASTLDVGHLCICGPKEGLKANCELQFQRLEMTFSAKVH